MPKTRDEDGTAIVRPSPDPTVLTREASEHAKESADKVDELRDKALQRELKLRRQQRKTEINEVKGQISRTRHSAQELLRAEIRVIDEKFEADHRILALMESHRLELKDDADTHRLELKSDGEKTLTTATIAAEKAVQAALAAAEKARDQQTIASQLATTKAEEASKERQDQQGEQFTTGIASLQTGFNDVKLQLSELRAERRGNQEQVIVARDNAADLKPLVDIVTALVAAQQQQVGKGQQVAEKRADNQQVIAIAALFAAALGAILVKLFGG
jgi:hypothetical protein